ncbi:TonB family protein [Oleiharenicola lentus]|uniref:TonB family protein n=1 Tax=Oleiharenicola lentus TaxID=2508720 RepID=UPI003F66318E
MTIHALIVALIFLTTWVAARQAAKAPQIFDLVQGPGNNIYETEAPKKGNTKNQVKIELPEPPDMDEGANDEPVPMVDVEEDVAPPPVKEPAKQTEAIIPPKVPTKTSTKPAPKPTESKTKTDATKAKPSTNKKVSYDSFKKSNPIKNPSKSSGTGKSKSAASYKKIDVRGIATGVANGSAANDRGGAGGTALSRAEMDKLDTYISFLVQEVRRIAAEDSPGLSDQLKARVQFDISASGNISNVKIATSSGSKEFDDFALKVFRSLRNTGPTPTRKGYTWIITFTMDPDA